MKTFAQLKRDIKEGSKIKTILNNIKPEKNGQIREIGKVQSNAIAFEIPKHEQKRNIWGELQTLSWLWWGKASQYEYEDNIFKVFDENKNLCFIYEILEE
jgi:hypothetical protein